MGISSGINTLRLRSKFYLSFGAVLMLGALVAALMMAMMMRSSASYKQVLETDRGVAELALTIRVDKLRISDSLRGRLLHPYGDLGEQELKNLSNGGVELTLRLSSLVEVQRWILSWAGNAQVVAPEELRKGVQEAGARIVERT